MRDINVKNALIGALAASLIFLLLGAGNGTPQQEEIATDLVIAGIQYPVLVTNMGTIIRMGREKKINVRTEEEMTVELKEYLATLR